MCGNRKANNVSVIGGHRPQIRCEGHWRKLHMDARHDIKVMSHRRLSFRRDNPDSGVGPLKNVTLA